MGWKLKGDGIRSTECVCSLSENKKYGKNNNGLEY